MNGGGVAIYTRKQDFKQTKVADSNVVEFLFCTLQELNTSIVCTYKRPQKSLRDFVNEFDNILTQVNRRCFVVGDFNVNLLECPKQNLLISLMHKHGFTEHVKKTNNRQEHC